MKLFIIAFLIIIFLGACQNTPYSSTADETQQPLFLDEKYPNHHLVNIESEQYVFALDEDMRHMVTKKLKAEKDIKKRTLKLLKHIFDQEEISISYSSHANVNAREAYHNQTANCLSLTIMAYALAKEADLNVRFQQVDTPEYWVRNGQYNLLTGHVNLLVKQNSYLGQTVVWGASDFQIDFDPQASKSTFKRTIINKNTVLAMFYNNKGAEALVVKDYVTAYSYFKAAATIAPLFSSTWANLGVLYKLTRQAEEAKIAYRYAISLNSDNLTAMENLAIILTTQQNFEEAKQIQYKLHLRRSKNPYYYALLADEAFYRGKHDQAIKLYKKALKLERRAHEFYFGLAKVYYRTGKLELAKNALEKAVIYNKTPSIDDLYLAKLNFLKTARFNY